MDFSIGDKVVLGNGSSGIVKNRVERAGFSGYRVEITDSEDLEQVGRTVAANPEGLKKQATVQRMLVRLGTYGFICDMALTPQEKSVGLQKHAGLGEGEGMIFPFEPPALANFHMGSVGFPIDIIFVSNGRVAKVVSNIQPNARGHWSCARTTSVIEVRGGFCASHNIRVGTTVKTGANAREAASSYDLLRTLTTADKLTDEDSAPSSDRIVSTLEGLLRAGKMRPLRELATEIYSNYLATNPEVIGRSSMSSLEADRLVQAWDSRSIWLNELKRIEKLLPKYSEYPEEYQDQLAWMLSDVVVQLVEKAHDLFDGPLGEDEEAKDLLALRSASRLQALQAKYGQALYAMGPSYLEPGGHIEAAFYKVLDFYDAKEPKQVEAAWMDSSAKLDFMGRDAVVRALVDSGYPQAIGLLRMAQMQSEPDVRQDTDRPGAVRRLSPDSSWSGQQMPADTPGIGDMADRKHWDQAIGYDPSADMDGVGPMRPSAGLRSAGGDIHPGDRVKAMERADGLKEDQSGVCLEVQGESIQVKFDGEPIERWLKNDMVSKDQEKDQILQEIEQEKKESEGGGGAGGGGLAGLMGG